MDRREALKALALSAGGIALGVHALPAASVEFGPMFWFGRARVVEAPTYDRVMVRTSPERMARQGYLSLALYEVRWQNRRGRGRVREQVVWDYHRPLLENGVEYPIRGLLVPSGRDTTFRLVAVHQPSLGDDCSVRHWNVVLHPDGTHTSTVLMEGYDGPA